jgi:hypothetical protein
MDYAINDRMKEARLALNLSQRAFSKGIFLKSPGYSVILKPIGMRSTSAL